MRRLLVVDDSPTIRRLVELTFRGVGWSLEFASTGQEGIAHAKAFSPDVILLDFVLPDMRGVDECICTFFLGERHFGIDVALVGEVVTIDAIAPVPMSPPALRGLFNLRGTPVALVDLADVLGIDARATPRSAPTALVVRRDELVVGFPIDRMEAVVSGKSGRFIEPGTDDHPAVRGFLEIEGTAGAVTVIEPAFLLERIEATRFLGTDAG